MVPAAAVQLTRVRPPGDWVAAFELASMRSRGMAKLVVTIDHAPQAEALDRTGYKNRF